MHLLEIHLSEDQAVQDRDGDDYYFRLTATVNEPRNCAGGCCRLAR
ncbi:MAG: hypothetical protein KDJ28_13010 [Candidatus Competibacteraceae bacterium]|nr:hypothetical protein [Candidatus Competibacteraceae bacterium]